MRAYPVSREWLTLLIRRMDAVAAVATVYRLAASLSPGIDALRSRVEFHRRGRFDATITAPRRPDFRTVIECWNGLTPCRRRTAALSTGFEVFSAGYDYLPPPARAVLDPDALSVWEDPAPPSTEPISCVEPERLRTTSYIAVEFLRDALERPGTFASCTSGVDGQRKCPANLASENVTSYCSGDDNRWAHYLTRSRFMGGLRASMYFFAVKADGCPVPVQPLESTFPPALRSLNSVPPCRLEFRSRALT